MAPAIRTENGVSVVPSTIADGEVTKEMELHSPPCSLRVEFQGFYGYPPSAIDRRFNISLSNSSYVPKVEFQSSPYFADD